MTKKDKIEYCYDCGFPLPEHARGCPRSGWED